MKNRGDMASTRSLMASLFLLLGIVGVSNGGLTSHYIRNSRPSIDMPLDTFPSPKGFNAPEQVHI